MVTFIQKYVRTSLRGYCFLVKLKMNSCVLSLMDKRTQTLTG
jgi:hypothetical protein